MLAWVASQESTWDAREGESWQELRLNGLAVDPFDVERMNLFLQPGGLAYGAGFSRGLAPTCFLGELCPYFEEQISASGSSGSFKG